MIGSLPHMSGFLLGRLFEDAAERAEGFGRRVPTVLGALNIDGELGAVKLKDEPLRFLTRGKYPRPASLVHLFLLHDRLQECNGDEILKAEAGAKVQKFTEWALKCIGFHSRCQENRGKGNHNTVIEVHFQLSAFKIFLDLAGNNLSGKDFTEAFDAACFPLTLFSSSFDLGWASGISAYLIQGLLGMLVEGGADNVNQCFLEASRFGSTELVRILLQVAMQRCVVWEGPGMSYGLNWALAGRGVIVKDKAYYNLKLPELEKLGAWKKETSAGFTLYLRSNTTEGNPDISKAQFGKLLKQDHGHRVRLATHSNFKEFVLSAGLEFFPLGGDPKVLAELVSRHLQVIFRDRQRFASSFQVLATRFSVLLVYTSSFSFLQRITELNRRHAFFVLQKQTQGLLQPAASLNNGGCKLPVRGVREGRHADHGGDQSAESDASASSSAGRARIASSWPAPVQIAVEEVARREILQRLMSKA
ncbi:F-box/ankyrin repeat protein SKIP35 [Platanthera guangdongensis]|uniref:F-box/ankyrin repeat protein SKIP35 n=1 Tax=Platanthera guangdongensis TaxID=2320717 RepID=A0ABR2MLL3_9ASPA